MTNLLLPLLALITATLAGLGVLALAWPAQTARALWASAALAGLAAAGALAALLLGISPAPVPAGIGLPAAGFHLGLDPLAAYFALLLFGTGAAICAALAAEPPTQAGVAAPVPIALAALGLAVLGTGGFARATGVAVAGGAIWLVQPPGRAAAMQLATALGAAAVIAAADAAPQPALLWLALLGPGALAGLVPFHANAAAAQASPTPAAAVLAGLAPTTGVYLMLRLLFGTTAVMPPGWWGLPLLLVGAASVLAGGWNESHEPNLDAALAGGTTRQAGLIATGIGIALIARAADLPDSTGMALGAVLLLAALQAIAGTALALAAGAIRHGAGTRALARMGGLVHRMPRTAVCLGAGMFSLTALPPSAGFAAIWLLFHAVLALPHAVTLPVRLLLCALAALLGLAAALNAASLLRVVGVACLGRPRNPRAAVAEEPPRAVRRSLQALAACALGCGVLAGPVLRLLAAAPARVLAETGLGPAATWLGVAAGAESPGYTALPVTALLLLAAGAALWLRGRQIARTGVLTGPAWNDGFAAPPAWLPFGDPATQADGDGFMPAPPLPRLRLHLRLPRCRVAPPAIPAPAVALVLAAVLLALCAWLGPA